MASLAGLSAPDHHVGSVALAAATARLARHYQRPEITATRFPGQLDAVMLRDPGRRDFLAHHGTDGFSGHLFGHAFADGGAAPLAAPALLDRLFAAIRDDRLAATLRELEGVFFAVVSDLGRGTTHLVTDRLGLRPLFVRSAADVLAWSSEAKGAAAATIALDDLDPAAVALFLELGHLVGATTPFAGVTLAPAASHGVWRPGMAAPCWSRYWSWAEVAQAPATIATEDAVAELGRLWPRAVARAASAGGDGLYLWLSGGFDSRLIAAELARQGRTPRAITFGQEASTEIAVARAVGEVLGIPVEALELDEHGWFDHRVRLLYKTDCAATFQHLHSASHVDGLDAFGDVFIEGFWGDALLGDSLHRDDALLDVRASKAVADLHYGGATSDHDDPFYEVPHIEPFLLAHRGRRFTRTGGLAVSDRSENVLPFVDGELIRFLMSLPDRLRRHHGLYAAFACAAYPEVFATIPHAKTGRTVAGVDRTGEAIRVAGRTLVVPALKVALADYERLLRGPAMLELLADLLDPARSRLARLGHDVATDFEIWRSRTLLTRVKARPGRHSTVRERTCRAASFELWAGALGV